MGLIGRKQPLRFVSILVGLSVLSLTRSLWACDLDAVRLSGDRPDEATLVSMCDLIRSCEDHTDLTAHIAKTLAMCHILVFEDSDDVEAEGSFYRLLLKAALLGDRDAADEIAILYEQGNEKLGIKEQPKVEECLTVLVDAALDEDTTEVNGAEVQACLELKAADSKDK